MTEPIERIEWLAAAELRANDYNPNVVFTPELKLLEFSLLATGWIQPILVARDMTIIDGFHRTLLQLKSKACQARWGGLVPCVVMDIPRSEAIALTVRINRAKGSHVAVKMAELVKELVQEHGWAQPRVCAEIGATKQEVELLLQEGVFSAKGIKTHQYSKAWYPEVKKAP